MGILNIIHNSIYRVKVNKTLYFLSKFYLSSRERERERERERGREREWGIFETSGLIFGFIKLNVDIKTKTNIY